MRRRTVVLGIAAVPGALIAKTAVASKAENEATKKWVQGAMEMLNQIIEAADQGDTGQIKDLAEQLRDKVLRTRRVENGSNGPYKPKPKKNRFQPVAWQQDVTSRAEDAATKKWQNRIIEKLAGVLERTADGNMDGVKDLTREIRDDNIMKVRKVENGGGGMYKPRKKDKSV